MNDGYIFLRDDSDPSIFRPHEIRHVKYETVEAIERLAKSALRDGKDIRLDPRHVLALTARFLRLY
jgi:hypothetical protein